MVRIKDIYGQLNMTKDISSMHSNIFI